MGDHGRTKLFVLLFLEKPEEFCLSRKRKTIDLVKKECSPIGFIERRFLGELLPKVLETKCDDAQLAWHGSLLRFLEGIIAQKHPLDLITANHYHAVKDKGRQLFEMYPDIHIFKFKLDSYILLYLIALIVATFLLRHELRRNNYPPYLYITLIAVGLITGIIGSKIYYLFGIWNEFILSPYETFFNIAGSGWYGGFLLGGISVVLVLRFIKLPILKTLDILIPTVPIGQILGRLGCFLSGCCHGIPSNLPWALPFPNGLYPIHVKVHPTQLYEMSISFFIFILLWKLRKKEMTHGAKFGLYLVLAGLGRFMVEFYRLNPRVLFSLTVPQMAAIAGVMIGTFIIKYAGHKHNAEAQGNNESKTKVG